MYGQMILGSISKSYLESVICEAQAELSADHHGLHRPPAVAADCAPNQRAVSVCQHLHAALVGVPPSA